MAFRVVVADDAVLFRQAIADVLSSLPGVEVVGTASNGRIALTKVREHKPDLLTLDIEMPEMDGLAVLGELRKAGSRVQVIVVSALTPRGGELTMRALQAGAFDFVTKPDGANGAESRETLVRDLAPRVRALAHKSEIRGILRGGPPASPTPSAAFRPRPEPAAPPTTSAPRIASPAPPARPEMVLIGVSTGGPVALARILPEIPGNLGVPVLIVQHMPPVFTRSLADNLTPKCALQVKEAEDGEKALPNTVYIAPGGRQMKIRPGSDGKPSIQINDDPPENNCRPAVDYLFRSAANHFPGKSMAVILTGMGNDGTIGLRLLKRHGCFVVAQDEPTCVVYGMPKAAVDAGVADAVLPLESIAARIAAAVKGQRP
jgi:two-component system, chemotaxis family, protein-glutamate methylesterase/glutaminase